MKAELGERNVEGPYHHTRSNTYSEAEMANKFNRIEVHFDTPKGRHRAVMPVDTNVQAIFLDGAESRFLPGVEAKRHVPPKESVSVLPDDLPEADKLITGPGVCYLINGELHCW